MLVKLATLLIAAATLSAPCAAQRFRDPILDADSRGLVLPRSDGTTSVALKLEDQDSFAKPARSSNSQFVGWLALYPNRSASYSQPLELVVVDAMNRLHRFAGNFGMVYGWCFARDGNAVVFTYRFSHGVSPIGFEMRRTEDGALVHRRELEPVPPEQDEDSAVRRQAPAWALCAWVNARSQ